MEFPASASKKMLVGNPAKTIATTISNHGMEHQNKKRKKRKDHTALVPRSDTLSARSVLQTTPEELSLSVVVLENIYKMMGKDACGNQFLQLVRSYALPM